MKKIISAALAATMLLSMLTACGGDKPTEPSSGTSAPQQGEQGSTEANTYTTTVKGNEVKMTLNADQTEVSIEVMGMIVEAACEVSGNTLTMKGKISGNDQIWAGFAGAVYTLNDDGTATAADEGEPEGNDDENNGNVLDEYTTTVKGNDVKFTLNADRTEVSIEVMGMLVEAACEVSGNTLTMKGKISGNDQIWAGFAGAVYTLNSDGTAVAN